MHVCCLSAATPLSGSPSHNLRSHAHHYLDFILARLHPAPTSLPPSITQSHSQSAAELLAALLLLCPRPSPQRRHRYIAAPSQIASTVKQQSFRSSALSGLAQRKSFNLPRSHSQLAERARVTAAMAIFKRNARATDAGDAVRNGSTNDADSDASSAKGLRKFAQRKPANTAFKQQRLKAWQPILTPRTVLPTFFLVALIFAPIGAVLYYFAEQVNEFTLDYTQCSTAPATPTQAQIPSSKYDYQLHDKNTSNFQPPTWSWDAGSKTCNLYFSVPSRLDSSVFLYYKLTNYYQNHRRYVKSIDSNQLKGDSVAYGTIKGGTCKPVDVDPATNKIYYPCGLIANSVFNDTFSNPVLLNVAGSDSANQTYVMSEKNIVWPGEKDKYKKSKYAADQIVPPPFWQGATGEFGFPNGYSDGQVFDPSENEHFMVWMRVAGLPTFRKLYKRNDTAAMEPGRYLLQVVDNYPVSMFDGTKSVVFSTSSWVGGRNPFLGLSFIAVAALSVLLGLIFTARHLIKPRKLGDMSYLSWNQPDSK